MTLQEKYCEHCEFADLCDYTPHRCPKVRFLEGEHIEGFDLKKFDAVKSYFGEQ